MRVGDLLIVAICINRRETLVTKDIHFEVISKITLEFRVIVKE